MTSGIQSISRRELFRRILRRDTPTATSSINDEPHSNQARVAIIQGRFCLAYQKSFCSVCSERCPESNAIEVSSGIPRIVADQCTGCGICFDVCPAPQNAILLKSLPSKQLQP